MLRGSSVQIIMWINFAPIFRKSEPHTLSDVSYCADLRWKEPIVTQRTVGQTSNSEHLQSISLHFNWPNCRVIGFIIDKNVHKKILSFGNSVSSNVTRSTPRSRILMFDSSFDAPGSVLSSALQIRAVRHIGELVIHVF